MPSLQPQEQFAIVRQLADHTDLSTYYVKAVVRNSVTDAIIDTVILTDKGSGRFVKLWEVPADISGFGYFIDITTSVYSDSGYTTKASSYGDELEEYLVFDRIISRGGGSGGGSDVDYKKIGRMLNEAIKSIPSVKIPSLEPIVKSLNAMKAEIGAIEMPEMKEVDHTPVLKAIERTGKEIVKAVSDKEVTEVPDLMPILQKIEAKETSFEGVYARLSEIKRILNDFVVADMEKEVMKENSSQEKLRELAKNIFPLLEGGIVPKIAEKPDRVTALLS